MLLISWFISKYYYTKSTKDDIAAFNKLPQMVKQILLKTKADELTVLELNKILQKKKIYDSNSDDLLPYKCCPQCGSQKLERSSHFDYEHDRIYYFIECKICKWSEYTE